MKMEKRKRYQILIHGIVQHEERSGRREGKAMETENVLYWRWEVNQYFFVVQEGK